MYGNKKLWNIYIGRFNILIIIWKCNNKNKLSKFEILKKKLIIMKDSLKGIGEELVFKFLILVFVYCL